jgi:hypothetical protein
MGENKGKVPRTISDINDRVGENCSRHHFLKDKAMTPTFSSKPTEEELQNRILRQLEWRSGSKEVALLWHGYFEKGARDNF